MSFSSRTVKSDCLRSALFPVRLTKMSLAFSITVMFAKGSQRAALIWRQRNALDFQ